MARFASLVLTGATLLTIPTPAHAESVLWTLVASPLTVTTGVPTTITLTATNEDPLAAALSSAEIGCVLVTVPSGFAISSTAVAGSNAGNSWSATLLGNQVKVRTSSGGDRLGLLDWVRFSVTGTAMSAGSLAWPARAYRQQDCSGSGALLGVPPIVVVVGPSVTPTPVATATPKPTAAPTPMPTPTPTPIGPLPLPSLPLPIVPTPPPLPTAGAPSASAVVPSEPATSALPRPSGASSASAAPSSSADAPAGPTAAPADDGGGSPPGDGGAAAPPAAPADAAAAPSVEFRPADIRLGLGSIGILDGLDVWAVPAATIAGPGLIVLLWIAAQSLGAALWLPAARRLRTGAGRRGLRRRSG